MKKGIILGTLITTILAGGLCFAGSGKIVKKKMNLKQGWNLVGGVLNNMNVDNITNSNCINSMWKWNNEEKKWEVYSPDQNVQNLMKKYQLGKIDKINEGDGFWVYAKEDCVVDMIGEPPSVSEVQINTSAIDSSFETTISSLDSASENNVQLAPAYAQLLQDAEEVEFKGTVKEIPEIGTKSMNGFVFTLDSGDEVVLYGLGPKKFWDEAGIDRPTVGDNLTIDAFKVELEDGSVRYIIKKITDENGNSLTLRDEDTGLPVWAKGYLGKKEEMKDGKKQYKWGKNNNS